MKSFLIKLDKIRQAIRRDGLTIGGGRTLAYLGKYFEMIFSFKSGQVLIITGGVGDSANYRAKHVAEELNLHGIKTEVMIQDNPFLSKFADRFEIFIFHRTFVTEKVASFITRIKKQNKEIIFETDDLVFDGERAKTMEAYKNMSDLEKERYANGIGREILTDEYVKTCTTTTSYLAKILESYGKKVFVVPNKLSNDDLEIAEKILEKRKELSSLGRLAPDGEIRIGYFSGTMSHNRDFTTISEALLEVMEKYSQVRLILAGPLEIENKLNKFQERIEQLPFANRAKHFANIAGVDINLAPLEMNDPFCEAKSELKFFEAGIVGVPTVAVKNQTYSEAIENGVDGFLAGDTAEWVENISKLIEDRDFRIQMGEAAREKALRKYTNKNSNNEEYYNYLKSKL
jgi:glycosyltransferase involved in cell wall biosynthesis